MATFPTSDSYEQIAEWYDVEHDPFQDDAECYVSLMESNGDAQSRVLEIGSGTGRLAAALALAGHHVTGIEPSQAMRERAQARLRQLPERVARRILIVEGSATAFQLRDDRQFDTVLMGQNLLAHLLTSTERSEALSAIAPRLRPGGQLIVDVDLAGPRRLRETASQLWWQGTWSLRDEGGELTHFVTAALTRDPALAHLIHFYDSRSPDGLVRRTTARLSLALLQPGEVELALQHAGFSVVASYGDYSCSPYDASSERIIFDTRLEREVEI